MTSPKFQIPDEFKSQLTYTEPQDPRTEHEILASISTYQRMTSEKNIWCFWNSGLSNIPAWCRRNIVDWARINGPSWTIRVLDTVPDSPNHIFKYLPKEILPEAMVKGTMNGPYVGPHSSDFLRGATLYQYGGVYMDVGIILIRQLDRMGWDQLEDPTNPRQIIVPQMYGTTISNSWVASRKGDPFIKRWHDLFVYLWKDKTNYEGLITHPLLTFAQTMDFSESQKKGYAWEFIVGPVTVFEYISQVLAWMRLCSLEDAGDGFSGAEYQRDHILWYDTLPENWSAETVVGYTGQALFDALSTRTDIDPDTEEYKTAYKLVWRMLTTASMQKITHGKNLTKTPALGLLWDEKENEGKDNAPGTFAELLRLGSRYSFQKRQSIAFVKTEKPAVTMKKGLLEP
ncbi:hypothetical protein BT63DRAFT_284886 [Microthyrium microscopicum]|uniref:Capsule polysaccharide biosynthesis protein n=1 Tax=Microthyrium microscopicum TaxID=703497 RepID=A0A6A6UBD0_9PEZI|nr:hypothetical protein BT63DRAFT_284886 [Microthyrium microscopicum]